MKTLTQAHQHKLTPVWGGRSAAYFGLNLWMDQSFFNTTSDYKAGAKRPEPRIKAFHPKSQSSIHDEFIIAGQSFNFAADEIEIEWAELIKKATERATAAWSLDVGLTHEEPVRPSRAATLALSKAYDRGFACLVSEAKLRSMGSAYWSIDVTPLLAFPDTGAKKIYVKRQRVHSKDIDGRRRYKIGDSYDPDKRTRQHETSNSDLEHLITIDGCSIVTESNIHKLFPGCREHKRDWFALSDDQAAVLYDRNQLVQAIRKMLADSP